MSSVPSAGTAYNPGTGLWNIGALANGANATLTITVTVNTTAGVTNTATKTAEDQTDPNPGNNSASSSLNAVAADILRRAERRRSLPRFVCGWQAP